MGRESRQPKEAFRRRAGDLIVVTPRGTAYHRPNCPHLGGHDTVLLRPCLVCTPTPTAAIPVPGDRDPAQPHGGQAEVAVIRGETEFHAPNCVLVRPLHRRLQPCRDCGPEASWSYALSLGRRRNDDAERDTNHAIAHWLWVFLGACWFLGTLLSCCPCGSEGWFIPGSYKPATKEECEEKERRVAGEPKRVRFRQSTEKGEEPEGPSFEALSAPFRKQKNPPFLGGPATAKRLWGTRPAQPDVPLACRKDFETEALKAAMDRLASGTQKAYEGQLRWWRLFCTRRGVGWLLQGRDPQADEDLLVDFLLHTAVNGGRAPGTLKMRLAAIKSAHVRAEAQAPPYHGWLQKALCHSRKAPTGHAQYAALPL